MPLEYKKLKLNQGGHYVSENELNELGKEGWMLVCFNDLEDVYILMREIHEN